MASPASGAASDRSPAQVASMGRIAAHYRRLAESSCDVVLDVGPDHVCRWASPSCRDVLGWDPADLVGRTTMSFVHPQDAAAALDAREHPVGGVVRMAELRVLRADGTYQWVAGLSREMTGPDGLPIGRIISLRDIQEERAAREALRQSERRYRLLAENASDVVLAADADGTYTWASESAGIFLGWRPEDLIGRSFTDILHPDDLREVRGRIRSAADGQAVAGEARVRCADGSYRWCGWTVRRADLAADEPGFVGSLVDIAARKEIEGRLAHAATHDPLTGLANRALLIEETDRALAAVRGTGGGVALLLLDLDQFKYVNDSLGHPVGDQVLSAAADTLRRIVPPGALVARHGGDELVVLVRDMAGPVAAGDLAQRLIRAFRQPMAVALAEVVCTVSIGYTQVSGYGPADRSALDLLREADIAMYAAKAAGRDRAEEFTPGLRSAVEARARIERDLRHALAAGELEAWFQPEVNLRSGRVVAAETLLRWRPAQGRVRTAGEFIGVAEDSGLIVPIGRWVLGQACRAAARWERSGVGPLLVRVNLSAVQLGQPDLLGRLDTSLAVNGLAAARLGVEITETVMLAEHRTVRDNLRGIRERGIDLAIDDFGTGYGSLSYLREYPVSVLKLDRSFVAHVATSPRDRALVAGIIALAERLGISVTAEGVETPAQEAVLRSLGCTAAQGFHYAPALPADDLVAFITRDPRPDSPGSADLLA